MTADEVLDIVLREMSAYASGWRLDWSDFDGRMLRNQLDRLRDWSLVALSSDTKIDFTQGTEFLNRQERE